MSVISALIKDQNIGAAAERRKATVIVPESKAKKNFVNYKKSSKPMDSIIIQSNKNLSLVESVRR